MKPAGRLKPKGTHFCCGIRYPSLLCDDCPMRRGAVGDLRPLSFIHGGDESMASYRYRAKIPAGHLLASINDLGADWLVFAKPTPEDYQSAVDAKAGGQGVIVDFCDDHFNRFSHYPAMARIADAVTCPTEHMASVIRAFVGVEATVIPDPYEFAELAPHCNGNKTLWFGHAVNWYSIERVLGEITVPLSIVSNVPGTMPWSLETMKREFAKADIVIVPETAPYKSCNRTVEAIRQGCFVVAEEHPSLHLFMDQAEPNIWIGSIKEGIEWASRNQQEANIRTLAAQRIVNDSFSPRTQASAWKSLLAKVKSGSTSGQEKSLGQAGSASICALTP